MASKKKGQLSRYCRIYQWVEAQDPELAKAICNLCLERSLDGGPAGATFLYPDDSAFRAEIVDKAYSDAADDAVKLIQSLILPDVFARGADFNRRSVGNRLGVKLEVKSADDARVRFTNGLELAPAKDFVLLAGREGRAAVWHIVSGRPPLTGEAYSAPNPERRAKGGAEGTQGGGGDGGGIRCALACAVQNDYDRCMRADRCRSCNPFLAKVVSLLNYLKLAEPEVYAKVTPVLDYEPVVSFYLLVEPFKCRGDFLLSEATLCAWGGCDEYTDALAEYEAAFRLGSPPPAEGPYVARDRAAITSQVDSVRQAFGAQSNPRAGPQFVQDAYAELARQNAIRGLGPVLPAATEAALPFPKKLWQDEFRFTLHEALQALRAAPYSQATLARIFGDVCASWPGNDYAAELRLANVADQKANVAPRAELLLLAKFVNSTDFLYTPVDPEAVGPPRGSMNPTDEQIYNRNAVALANLRRTTGMARAGELSPQTERELRRYALSHGGRLPPSVLALASSPA